MENNYSVSLLNDGKPSDTYLSKILLQYGRIPKYHFMERPPTIGIATLYPSILHTGSYHLLPNTYIAR